MRIKTGGGAIPPKLIYRYLQLISYCYIECACYLIRLKAEGVTVPPELQAHVEKVAAGMACAKITNFSSYYIYAIDCVLLQHLAGPKKIKVFITSGFTSEYVQWNLSLTL